MKKAGIFAGLVASAIIAVGSFGSIKKAHAEEMNLIGLSNELIRLQRATNGKTLEVIDESFIEENFDFVKSLSIGDSEGVISLSEFAYCNVDNGYLNIREGAGTDKKIIGRWYGGSVAAVIRTENGWTKIISGNVSGYVINELDGKAVVLRGEEAVEAQKKRDEKKRRVLGTYVNLRAAATTNSRVVHVIPGYAEVTILEKTNASWYKVSYIVYSENFNRGVKTYTGYINTSYLSNGFYYAIEETQQVAELKSNNLLDNIAWPYPGNYVVASDYGDRTHPKTGVYQALHTGIDIGGRYGDPVVSALDGVVTGVGWDNGGGGNYVVVCTDLGGVKVYCHYLHLSKQSVFIGQTVKKGQQVGTVGSTGTATGPHLHFTMKIISSYREDLNDIEGKITYLGKVDPINYLFKYPIKWLDGVRKLDKTNR